jgi:hypothetical protein
MKLLIPKYFFHYITVHQNDHKFLIAQNSLIVDKLIWVRCYHHSFLRFLPIFCEKFGFFQ